MCLILSLASFGRNHEWTTAVFLLYELLQWSASQKTSGELETSTQLVSTSLFKVTFFGSLSLIMRLIPQKQSFCLQMFFGRQIIGKYLITALHYSWVVIFELWALYEAHQHNWDTFSCDNPGTALSWYNLPQCKRLGPLVWGHIIKLLATRAVVSTHSKNWW